MKKAVFSLLAAALLCSAVPAHAFVPESVETVSEKSFSYESDTRLHAEILPGRNLLTGTDKAVMFDTSADLDLFTVTSNFPEKIIETGWQESNRSLRLGFPEARDVISSGHHQAVLTAQLGVTLDRPAYFTVSTEGVYAICEFGGAWIYQNISETYKKEAVADNFKGDPWNTDTLTFKIWNVENYKQTKYIDNIAVIPYYQVTYKNVGRDGQVLGEDVVTYTLGATAPSIADDGSIVTANGFAPTHSLSEPGSQFLGWSTEKNGAVMSEIPFAGEDIVLYPVWSEMSFMPGTNVLTGTKKALIFDKESDVSLFTVTPVYDASKTVSQSWDGENERMKLHFPSGTDASSHFVAALSAKLGSNLDRPAYFTTRVNSFFSLIYFMDDGQIGENLSDSAIDKVVCGTNGGKVWNTDTLSLNIWNLYGYACDKYVDDVAVIPYFRVTYKNLDRDGNVLGDDKIGYTLGDTSRITVAADGSISLPETFVPTEKLIAKGASLLGWSTEQGAREPMTEIPLGESDIVLYPVWSEMQIVPGANLFTGTKTALTFASADELAFFDIAAKWDKSVEMNLKYDADYERMRIDFPAKTDASGHFVATLSAPLGIKLDRPAFLAAKSYALYVFYQFGEDGTFFSDTTGEWATKTVYANNAGKPWNTDVMNLDIWNIYSYNTQKYLDNFAIVPYYKVTYKNLAPDGSSLGDDIVAYTLGDTSLFAVADDGTITTAESFAPDQTLESTDFLGWSTEKNGTVMSEIPLAGEDIVLYPVYKAPAAPAMTGELSLRTSGAQGIRFKANIAIATHRDSTEYGFLVTRQALLDKTATSDDAFVLESAVPYVKGVAYQKDRASNFSYDSGDGVNFTYTAVLRGIPQSKPYYTEKMAVRPYVTVAGVNYYGTVQKASVEDAVDALLANNPEAAGDAYVKAILETLGR